MIYEFKNPVPCVTPLGEGYVWYVKPNGILENDELTVILCDSGDIRHFTTNQVKIHSNSTYEIKKKQ